MTLNPFENVMLEPINVKFYRHSAMIEYPELLDHLNVKWTIISGDNHDNGDYFCLGEDTEGCFYFVDIGYGSCTGCDRLMACTDNNQLTELRDEIIRKIRKFDSLDELVNWFKDNAAGQYWRSNSSDVQDFCERVNEMYSRDLLQYFR